MLDLGEECDDGNTISGDGCSDVCITEDGYVCSTPGQPCVSTCCLAERQNSSDCGEGSVVRMITFDETDCVFACEGIYVQAVSATLVGLFFESTCSTVRVDAFKNDCIRCDDNTTIDYALGPCPPAQCGNGMLELGEECDLGAANNSDSGDCLANCTLSQCGDGLLNSLGPNRTEECDPALTPTGSVKAEQKISNLQGNLNATLLQGDEFGSSSAFIGDLDGDGIQDMVVGARADDDGISNSGAVYIFFLNADGTVKAEQKISNLEGNLSATLDLNDRFGSSIASLGDLDGDGIQDIAVGAELDDDGAIQTGAVYILFLNMDGTVKTEQKISNLEGNLSATLDSNDRFGSSIASLGDLDGDGIQDIVVGATGDDDGAIQTGAVYILFLNMDGTVKTEQKISNLYGNLSATLDQSDEFGTSVASLGDLDGDGIQDMVVGAIGDDDVEEDSGAVYVLFLNMDGTVKAEQKISNLEGHLNVMLDVQDDFGSSIASLGDLDGDGIQDIVVGASADDDGAANSGAVYILFLNMDGTVKAEQKISNLEGNLSATLDNADRFGSSIASLGDLNGDGIQDIVVGATGDDDDETQSGAVYVLYLAFCSDNCTLRNDTRECGNGIVEQYECLNGFCFGGPFDLAICTSDVQCSEECDLGANNSDTGLCSTQCTRDPEFGCTYTQGFWKNFPRRSDYPIAELCIERSCGNLLAECLEYAAFVNQSAELDTVCQHYHAQCEMTCQDLDDYADYAFQRARGSACIIYARQWLAFVLNVGFGGGIGSSVPDSLWMMLLSNASSPHFADMIVCEDLEELDREAIIRLAKKLDNYNIGIDGPGHCTDEPACIYLSLYGEDTTCSNLNEPVLFTQQSVCAGQVSLSQDLAGDFSGACIMGGSRLRLQIKERANCKGKTISNANFPADGSCIAPNSAQNPDISIGEYHSWLCDLGCTEQDLSDAYNQLLSSLSARSLDVSVSFQNITIPQVEPGKCDQGCAPNRTIESESCGPSCKSYRFPRMPDENTTLSGVSDFLLKIPECVFYGNESNVEFENITLPFVIGDITIDSVCEIEKIEIKSDYSENNPNCQDTSRETNFEGLVVLKINVDTSDCEDPINITMEGTVWAADCPLGFFLGFKGGFSDELDDIECCSCNTDGLVCPNKTSSSVRIRV